MKKLTFIFFCLIAVNSLFAQSMEKVVDSNNVFAFKMFKQLSGEHNLIFSPFSISSALAMTYAGARGETEKQMSHVLCFGMQQDSLHISFEKLVSRIESDTQSGMKLSIANSIWVQKKYHFSDTYFNLVKTEYHSQITNLDFINEPEKSLKIINSWVEEKTDEKIKDLLPKGAIRADTRMVLVNAIYFHSVWQKEFSVKATRKDTFHLEGKKIVSADFMNSTDYYACHVDDQFQVVEIPYKDNKTSMLIFLPVENSKNPQKEVDYAYYTRVVNKMGHGRVQLSLPKFKIKLDFNLTDKLSGMGMPVAFSDYADFSGMTGEKDLAISKVYHKAFIDVTEEGTEAAASTAVVMRKFRSVFSEPETIVFKADHPFIYIIRDNTTGSILFMGEIKNPAKEE